MGDITPEERRKRIAEMSNSTLADGLQYFAHDAEMGLFTYNGPPNVGDMLNAALNESAKRLRSAQFFSVDEVAELLKRAAQMGIDTGKEGTDVPLTASGIAGTVLLEKTIKVKEDLG